MAKQDVTISTEAGMPVTAADLRSSLQTYTEEAAPVTENFMPFLKLDKHGGGWMYGQEGIEVEPNSRWAINPLSIEHGFVAWHPDDDVTEKLGEVMVPFTKPQPDKLQLPDVGGSWDSQVSFQLACISGDDEGTQVGYTTTSKGGLRAHRTVIDAIIKQLDDDPENPVPVVELDYDSYEHKNRKYGTIYTPEFKIVAWAPLNDTSVKEAKTKEPKKQAASRSRKARGKSTEGKAAPARRRRAA